MDPLVVPPTALETQAGVALPEAPASMRRDDGHERGDHRRVATDAGDRRPIVRRPREPHDVTGAADRQLMFIHQHRDRLSFRGRRCATTAQRGDRDVEPVDSLQPCCTRDEGGPLEAGMQVQASNPLELRG